MRKFTRTTHTVGLPPGTLKPAPSGRSEKIAVAVMAYDEQSIDENSSANLSDCLDCIRPDRTNWVSIDGAHDVTAIEALRERFDLHPLMLEDVLNTSQRPKVERFGDNVYLVVRMLDFDVAAEEIRSTQLSIILSGNTLISIVDGESSLFGPVRERVRAGQSRIRELGAPYLAYTLLDIVVDHYFVVLEGLGEHIEGIEEALTSTQDPDPLHAIHRLKRELIYLRKAVWPLRETIATMMRDVELPFHDRIEPYLRDLHDHTVQVIETIESYRDLNAGMLETHLSMVSNRMNEVMKTLTIIATLFIPLTFLTGIYGMNFDHMPELHPPWAYPVLWAIMIGIAVVMLRFFQRRGWL
jgi:magnesium transporter